MYTKSFIPFRGYFSSPFSKWQGSLQSEHPVELVADTAKRWLELKEINPAMFDDIHSYARISLMKQNFIFFIGAFMENSFNRP